LFFCFVFVSYANYVDNNNEKRYYYSMIRSFTCKETEKIFNRQFSKKLPASIQKTAIRKLWSIDVATCVETLRFPPGNHLEKLSGDRKGQYSIRINKQWRICFKWNEADAYQVEIIDYH